MKRRQILKARWLLREAKFASRAAKARAFYWYLIRRYECEICMDCGRRVGVHTGSWWHADEALWEVIVGDPSAVMCPPCFTLRGDDLGIAVKWVAVEDARP